MTQSPPNSATIDLQAIRHRLADGHLPGFWRSLDEAAATPEFEEYIHREFPSQLAVWNDPVGRRRFLKLMAASLALAGVTGCTRNPQEKIVPYVRASDEIVPGRPQFFATAMPRGGYGYGVLVESHEGRPTKIEGNPDHPASLGGTDVFQQASILDLYDPDRSQTVRHRGMISTWELFVEQASQLRAGLQKKHGRGFAILTEAVSSPTLIAQLGDLLRLYPEARWHSYEPVNHQHALAGTQLAFGEPLETIYDFGKARIVVALDSDFMTDLPGSLRYIRDFVDQRRPAGLKQTMNRLYVAESTPTVTGASADHRLPLKSSEMHRIAAALLSRLRSTAPSSTTADSSTPWQAWLNAVVADLQEHRGTCLVIAGPRQPPQVHAMVQAINQTLGNIGQTIKHLQPVLAGPAQAVHTLDKLVEDILAGHVQTLLMIGGNPVYTAPGEFDFATVLQKATLRIHLSEFVDETSQLCDWHLPAAHYLESWSDIRCYDGTASLIQPLIAPLYGGKTAHELLALLIDRGPRKSYEILTSHWRTGFSDLDFGKHWQRSLHDGLVQGTAFPGVQVNLKEDFRAPVPAMQTQADHAIEIDVRPDPGVGDGRYANNGWLQELPRPLTKITWDNIAAISPSAAERLGIQSGDVLGLTVSGRKVQAPAWIMPGQADDCVSLTFGYGRTHSGHVGTNIGYNAWPLISRDLQHYFTGTVELTGVRHTIATTQHHHNMEGRDLVRVTTLSRANSGPSTEEERLQAAERELSFYPGFQYEGNAWGMVIDQTACVGCNACVVACQSENNIPVVGKEQVIVGREMHWLRIDRYYHGDLDEPEIYFQPMMCVHCEQAPCEVVCPVGATVHDSEGTSNMVYNRCVGTRYCSNNCPYKVRRFNYLQFSDQTTPVLSLLRNPDVTVRSRGVMEKCSYCIQRISHARIDSKIAGETLVSDQAVQTACQQACPARAITFGNLNQPDSQAKKLKQSPLNYSVLEELDTRPRTSWLARVVNPHPDLPVPGAVNASSQHPEQSKEKT